MSDKTVQDLRHALGNAKAEAEALKSMLGRAADRLEKVVEAECSAEEQVKALSTAKRIRNAIEQSDATRSKSP